MEPQNGIGGTFYDTRRGIRSIMGWKEFQGEKKFKIVSRRRSGHKWVKEIDLPPLVVKAYLRITKDRDAQNMETG